MGKPAPADTGRRRLLGGILMAGGVIAAAGALRAANLPALEPAPGDAKAAGFSGDRFKVLTQGMTAYVDQGQIPGFITAIWRHGKLAHTDVVGWQDQEAAIPLKRDTIFRVASMTKPVASVATLILLEEGKFRMEDPIDRWIPELANRKVLKDPAGAIDDTYPSPRPITVGDLLTQRPGLPNHFDPPSPAVAQVVAKLRDATDMDDWLKKLADAPLLYPPGDHFIYGFSMDVLGALVARVSGMRFPDFLEKRLFGPLGMADTGFFVPPAKASRLVVAYHWNPKTMKRIIVDPAQNSRFLTPPKVPSGAGGLVSTIDDYAKFGRMLLGYGALDGHRILSRKTVELMTQDYLTPEQRQRPFFQDASFWAGQGYGLGVSVVDNVARRGEPSSVGQYGWNGAYGTLWVNDPKEGMTAVLMIQTSFDIPAPRIQQDFRTLVYQAIDD